MVCFWVRRYFAMVFKGSSVSDGLFSTTFIISACPCISSPPLWEFMQKNILSKRNPCGKGISFPHGNDCFSDSYPSGLSYDFNRMCAGRICIGQFTAKLINSLFVIGKV